MQWRNARCSFSAKWPNCLRISLASIVNKIGVMTPAMSRPAAPVSAMGCLQTAWTLGSGCDGPEDQIGAFGW